MDSNRAKELLDKGDTYIYRYRIFNEYALNELANSKLYFSSLESFNDPLEVANLVTSDIEQLSTESLKADINHRGYACFCRSGVNLNMWAHYADGLRGMCFVYDAVEMYESLISLNPNRYQFNLEKVDYLAKVNSVRDIIKCDKLSTIQKLRKISLATTASKMKAFEYEDEVRIIIGRLNDDDLSDYTSTSYMNADGSVHSRELTFSETSLKTVIFGEKMQSSQRSLIEKLLTTRRLSFKEAIALPVSNQELNDVIKLKDL